MPCPRSCAPRRANDRRLSTRLTPWPRITTASPARALEPVAQDELLSRLHEGEVLILDVRPEAEYAAGHIPGALNVPHDQLAARLAELPESTEIVAYCRGRYCVFAPDAVRLLRARGLSARPLEGAARLAAGRAARDRVVSFSRPALRRPPACLAEIVSGHDPQRIGSLAHRGGSGP